jgi:DUF1680 family protein
MASAQQAGSNANLAVVATASSSYVSGDTTLAALQDGQDPQRSDDDSRRSYGNWNRTGTQWVQYDWRQAVSTHTIDVYWWDDHRGVRLPRASRLLYWDGSAFVPVAHPSGLGVAADRYNTTTFDEVRTTRLRLEIDSNDTFSTGILEWKVYDSGKSPAFPPSVEAGEDRVVVVGGKTWLTAAVRSVAAEGKTDLTWTRDSGPGEVTFEDSHKAATTATFSAAGEQVLRLTARSAGLNGSGTLRVKAVTPPSGEPLDAVSPASYKIDSPLWSARTKALIVNWIPHCIAMIDDPNLESGGIINFIEAANKLAGRPYKGQKGAVFADTAPLNTVEAICMALRVDSQGDPEILKAQQAMKATLDDWIPKILAAQEPDGYFQTAFTLGSMEHWSPDHRDGHEGYIAGYFIEAAISHYEMTGRTDDRFYKAARRLADCWVANVGPSPKKPWYDGHEEMELALVRLARLVEEVEGKGKADSYVALAKFLLDCRRDGGEYDQSHLPVTQQYEALGHAVRAVYCYSAMADVAMETRDKDYQSAVLSLWDNIVHRKYYVTGGVGSGETSEGFGPDYSLRNNAYCESCSSCGEIFFQHRLNLTTADGRYADLLEETLYNALLGSVDLEGKNFYYQNPLEGGGPRYSWHGCPCCVGNIPRVLLALPTWAYAKGQDGLYVNLFVGGTVMIHGIAGTDVQVVQRTDYPWHGTVSIAINPASPQTFSVKVRVPNRGVSCLYSSVPDANGVTSISVNGKAVTPTIDKGYAVIHRQWKSGDRIDLVLPMKVQRVKASDRIVADRGRVAIRCGPLVYCIERVDQDITQVLNPQSGLTSEWRPDLLAGVMVIKAAYADGSAMTAIPYYSRANRGSGGNAGAGARVWIKDQ